MKFKHEMGLSDVEDDMKMLETIDSFTNFDTDVKIYNLEHGLLEVCICINIMIKTIKVGSVKNSVSIW